MPQPFTDEAAERAYDYDQIAPGLAKAGAPFRFLGGNRLNRMLAATPADRVDDAHEGLGDLGLSLDRPRETLSVLRDTLVGLTDEGSDMADARRQPRFEVFVDGERHVLGADAIVKTRTRRCSLDPLG